MRARGRAGGTVGIEPVGIMDLARVARGCDTLGVIAARNALREGDVVPFLRSVAQARSALTRTVNAIGAVDGAEAGSALLARATGLLRDAGDAVGAARVDQTSAMPWARDIRRVLAASAPLGDAATAIREAVGLLDDVPGLRKISAETSGLVLRGTERDAALAEAAARGASSLEGVHPDDLKYVTADVASGQRPVTRLLRGIVAGPFHIQYHGQANVPRSGAMLLLGTHGTDLDCAYVAAGVDRPVHFMAAKEVTDKLSNLDPLLTRLGAFPIDRAGGEASAPGKRIARELLTRGEAVQMFPDGGISRLHTGISEPKAGASLLALQTGTPVVPGASYGLQAARARVGVEGAGRHVFYGEPIVFRHIPNPTYEQISEAREIIAQRTDELARQAQWLYESARR